MTGVFTVNVSGPERHDGEKPTSYVLLAPDMAEAKRQAWLVHVWAMVSENGTIRPDGTWPGMPDTYASGHPYEPTPTGPGPEVHDTVVIDCEEFPCLEAVPDDGCGFFWHDLRTATEHTRALMPEWTLAYGRMTSYMRALDTRLEAVGYQVPAQIPEETTW